jgi:TonB family protein
MIIYAMLYAAAVGGAVLAATWALATVLRRHGQPERLVWLAGLVLAFALPAVALTRAPDTGVVETTGTAAVSEAPTGVIGLPTVFVVPAGPSRAAVEEVLLAVWALASLLLGLRYAVASVRLARARRRWRQGTMDGSEVWLTDETGPAVAGIVRPRVLVPSWMTAMPADRRSLVLLHEREHIRAGDPWLMLVSRLAPILVPWNPIVWLVSAGLLRAVELDCDRRVLRRRPDVRTYGDTLIEISARDSGRLVAVAAFAESEAPLRKRILSMTTPSRAVSIVALLTSMVFGVVLMIAAFEIPVPTIRAELHIGGDEPATGAEPAEETVAAESMNWIAVTELEGREREDLEAELRAEVERARAARAAEVVATERRYARIETSEAVRARLETAILEWAAAERIETDVSAAPTFTPFTQAPQLTNTQQVQRALMQEYPTVLRDSGVGGTVNVWFFIDEEGRVQSTRIDDGSGYEAIDRAALNVAGVMRFSPALNREQRVPVWVSLPITFQVR